MSRIRLVCRGVLWSGLFMLLPLVGRAWTASDINFRSSAEGWVAPGRTVMYTGPNGQSDWFRYVMVAPASSNLFEFKMAALDWTYNWGGNLAFPKNQLSVMNYFAPGNSRLSGGITNGYRYVFTVENPVLSDMYISVMELSRDQAQITGVTGGEGTYATNQAATMTVYFATNPPPEEKAYIRYTTNNWTSFSIVGATLSGQVASASISNLQAHTAYHWYALASSASASYLATLNDYGVDASTLTWINNYGSNYTFTTPDSSAAWIWHNNDRVIYGSSVQFWARIGYINADGSNPWVTNAAIYATTNGVAPDGGYGVASNSSTFVLRLALDHIEDDPSPYGKAMKWQGILSNAPAFTAIKYKIGCWQATGLPERFAEYGTSGADNNIFSFQIGTVGDPVLTVSSAQNGSLNANYTTSKFFLDEVAGETVPLTITFDPGQSNVVAAEVFSNLNRRDWADQDGDSNGVPDGIMAPDGNTISSNDVNQYYMAYPMVNGGGGHYTLTLAAQKTGAYRLTARWKTAGATNWSWYTNWPLGRRDHAIVVSPLDARSIRLYELNAMIVAAAGTAVSDRSTFEDLYAGAGATHTNRWTLDYVRSLGCNWLWFQPIHPNGIEGRLTDPNTGVPYSVGSPYAVKNFFEVAELLSKGNSRATSMAAFTNFVAAADAKSVNVMLDAPFNHTSPDCELADTGVPLFSSGASATNLIRDTEARFYSRTNNYALRASSAGTIAVAPDRGDFGKWGDVRDIYFGRYAALVDINPDNNGNYLNEGDWMDTSVGDENSFGAGNGHFDAVTRKVWKYFASYVTYWLDMTGYPANPSHAALSSHAGLDGLRCDFGQGLPPQCWEYIINVARARKWNFVFMTETLDGGATTYRSNRHFDILNESIIFPLRNAGTTTDYRNVFEQRRSTYGQGLVLLNTTSHDEENYDDPWQAVVRMAVCGSIDGATMVFYGQELGVSRTWGFDAYQLNFGKQIANFMVWNSLMPAWNNTDYGLDQLYPVIAGINAAREASPALRSSNRYFLNQVGGATHQSLWAVAKYETAGASPASSDVVFAFANLDRNASPSGVFNVDLSAGGTNLFGIRPARQYNVRNIAAYTASGHDMARTQWQWASPKSGSELLSGGLYVGMNKVPDSVGLWYSAPYEAQYLKLYDVTPPPAPAAASSGAHYALTNGATFSWTSSTTADDAIMAYLVSIGTSSGGVQVANQVNVGTNLSYTFSGAFGTTNYLTLLAVSAAGVTSSVAMMSGPVPGPGVANSPVVLLRPDDDTDHDGLSNADEQRAGTDPLDASSVFRIVSVGLSGSVSNRMISASTQPGKLYRILFNDAGPAVGQVWLPFGNTNIGIGAWYETNGVPAIRQFIDDGTPQTTSNPPSGGRFYRIEVR